jgi:hypothetical protein
LTHPAGSIFRRFSITSEEVTALKRVVLALALVVTFFTVTAMAGEWKGYVSDEKCGAKHAKDHNAKCVEGCVKGGAAPVFVTGGKVYKVDDAAKLQDHLGHDVTITGDLKGDTITVQDVKM